MPARFLSLFLWIALSWSGAAQWSPARQVAPAAASSPAAATKYALASDGDSYLLVTTGSSGTRAVHVDSEGRIADPNGIAVTGEVTSLSVAGAGGEWLILTSSGERLLRADGTVAYPSYLRGWNLAAVSNGRNFLVWSEAARQITMLEPDLRTAYPELSGLPSSFEAVASNGDVYAIAARSEPASVAFNIVDAGGRVRFAEPRVIDLPRGGNRAVRRIALTRVHDRFLLLWSEYEIGTDPAGTHDVAWEVRGIELEPDGDVASEARTIASGIGRGRYSETTLAWLSVAQAGPADAIVRWWVPGSYSGLQTTVGCGASFAAPNGTMASNGHTMVLASWSYVTSGPSVPVSVGVVLRGAAFACDPSPLAAAPPTFASLGAPDQWWISLVAGNTDAAALWSENGHRRAWRLSHDGRALGSLQVPSELNGSQLVRLATDGWGYLVAWRAADQQVRVARLTDAGQARPQVIPIHAVHSDDFDITWTGNFYVLVWSEGGSQIRATLLDRDLTVIGWPIDLAAADSSIYRTGVQLARGATDLLLTWYEGGSSLLPCGGCQNPQHVYAMRLDGNVHPLAEAVEIGGYGYRPFEILWSSNGWFARMESVIPPSGTRVARMDGSRLRVANVEGRALVPLGRGGTGLFRGSSIDVFDDSLTTSPTGPSWPHPADDLREAVFTQTQSGRLLVLFTARDPAAPHNGAHRLFVTSYADSAPRRRRAVH